MAVPYTFGNATTAIPLSQLDTNFATAITLGNTAVYLGNTTTSFGNVTLTNATITSGSVTLTSATVPTVIGGTTASSSLTLQSTSGVGTSDAISFKVGNNGATTAMTINTSGSVGVSTSSPFNGGITIDSTNTGTTSANLYFKSQSADADEGVWRQRVFNTAGSAYFEIAGVNDAVSSATIAWRAVKVSGNVIDRHEWYTAGSERMRIDSSGNVGIGLSNPSRRLHVYVNNTQQDAMVQVEQAGTGSPVLGFLKTGVYAWTTGLYTTDNSYRIAASGADLNTNPRLVIDTSGNLLVGTTSASGRITSKTTTTDNTTYPIFLQNSAGSTVGFFRSDGNLNTGTLAASPYNNTTAAAANMYVSPSGDVLRSTSSLRYKENVQDATHGLADILKLRAVTYKGKNDGDTVFGGLIAEEVHDAGLTQFVQYAEDGSPDALAYGNMVSLCIKAIQELKAEIDALKGAK